MHVSVNGLRLYVDVEGSGLVVDGARMREKPVVIMVHGGPGADHSHYKPAYSWLSEIAQVVYYDRRGNGRSEDGPPEQWTLAQWGDDLFELCQVLGIERPIILGTSFGGFVAQAYATRHPEHPAGLILISTAARSDFEMVYRAFGRRGGPEAEAVARSYWSKPTDASRALYRDVCVPLYGYADRGLPDWVGRALMRNATALHFNGPGGEQGQMDFCADLDRLRCPVLILAGEDDPITPPEFSVAIADALPSGLGTLMRYDRCGHGVIADRPQEARAAIGAFIARLDA